MHKTAAAILDVVMGDSPELQDLLTGVFKLAAPNLAAAKSHFGNAVNILKSVSPTVARPSQPAVGGVGSSLRAALSARKIAGFGNIRRVRPQR